MTAHPNPVDDLLQFPLMQAIFGRRARRFGMGMEIPSGPLAFRSRSDPQSLSQLEQAVLIAAGTGVSGWSRRFEADLDQALARTPQTHVQL